MTAGVPTNGPIDLRAGIHSLQVIAALVRKYGGPDGYLELTAEELRPGKGGIKREVIDGEVLRYTFEFSRQPGKTPGQ